MSWMTREAHSELSVTKQQCSGQPEEGGDILREGAVLMSRHFGGGQTAHGFNLTAQTHSLGEPT